MKYFALLLLLYVGSFSIQAQQNDIDSLQNLLLTSKEWSKLGYSDSLFNQIKSNQLAEFRTLYDLAMCEKEKLRLKKEKEEARLTRIVMLISIVSLFVLIILIICIVRYKTRKRQQLHKVENEFQMKKIEKAFFREDELRKEIELKNKELTSYTINFVQKTELIKDLKRNLQAIDPNDAEVGRKIAGLSKLVEGSYQVDREWEDFKVQFENVHRNFFQALKDRCPELTNGDMKLCALLKLNMNMKEAAKVLAISPESVKTARYRLRKKFGLLQDENLVDFVLSIGNEVKSNEEIEIPS